MEESQDMNFGRGSLSPDKGKRRLKTPTQILALEKFYNEHKYPSESMKLLFAEQIGLSEKQVSGWFCHRRSKDKKLLQDEGYRNRKQNLSTGAIHDSISGLRQESCNSTKQVDKHFDGKEVESKKFHGLKFSAAIPEKRGQPMHVEGYGVAEDRSSGSSTTSYERLLKQGVDDYTVKPRYSFWDDNYMLTDTSSVTKRRHVMDSRSSCLLGYVESPVLSLVKLKLGRQYREDGPPLATDFDALPPGAFDLPVRDSNSEPYYVGDSIRQRTSSIHEIVGEHKIYDKYRSDWISNGSCSQGSGYDRKLQRFNHRSDFIGCQLAPKASATKDDDHVSNRNIILDEEGDDFSAEASDDYRRNNMISTKYGLAGGCDNSTSHPLRLNSLKANASMPFAHSLPHHKYNAPLPQRELFEAEISKPTVKDKRNAYLNTVDNMQPRGTLKVLKKKIHKQKKFHESCNSVWPEMLMTSDTQITRKVHGKDFGSKMLR